MRLLHFFLTVIIFTSSALIYASVPQVVSDGNLTWQGFAVQGGYARLRLPVDAQVQINGSPLRLNDQGEAFVAFGRDHGTRSVLEWRSASRNHSHVIHVQPRPFVQQRVAGQSNRLSNLTAAEQRRLQQDSQRVDSARARRLPRNDWRNDFVWPVVGRVTAPFGALRSYNGEPPSPHWGIDIARPVGTPVIAPLGGVVTLAESLLMAGQTVIVDHGFGLSSTFQHLHRLDVTEGQAIRQGDIIGQVGASGLSAAPHLHWRVQWLGVWFDPLLLLEPQATWPRPSARVVTLPEVSAVSAVPVTAPLPPDLPRECQGEPSQLVLLSPDGRGMEWQRYQQLLGLEAACVMAVKDDLTLDSRWQGLWQDLPDKTVIVAQDAAVFALVLLMAKDEQTFKNRVLLLDPPVVGDINLQRLHQANQALTTVVGGTWRSMVSARPLNGPYQSFYQQFGRLQWLEQRAMSFEIGLITTIGLQFSDEMWQDAHAFVNP